METTGNVAIPREMIDPEYLIKKEIVEDKSRGHDELNYVLPDPISNDYEEEDSSDRQFASNEDVSSTKVQIKAECLGDSSDLDQKEETLTRTKEETPVERRLKNIECKLCSFVTNCKLELKRHKKTHSAEKIFKCDQCPYDSHQKRNLANHRLSHSLNKPFKCDQCPYASSRKMYLNKHKLTHSDDKRFKCDQCPYASNRKVYLNNHLLIHSPDKPF